MKSIYILLLLFASIQITLAQNSDDAIVKFNETYELANIILALTEHGKTDKNEVSKNTAYYQEVMAYFDQYSTHPLIAKVNYSREKWDKLLSFRTDAVAFEFNRERKLERTVKFYAMGKEINEFEDHLNLISDFAQKSGFLNFYNQHKSFYDSLQQLYEKSLMIPEVVSFLSREFKMSLKTKHQIIVSPLVGRMHCQRYFNKKSTSFINIPYYLYKANSVNDISRENLLSGLHMFFTEIDHDYVNPTTFKYKKLYKQNFIPVKWDKGSGYEKSTFATFNEYMTWAVYDIFLQVNFPDADDKITNEWHEVNSSRGFFVSQFFATKLSELYAKKSAEETMADLFPVMLNWCGEVADNLPALPEK